MKKFFMQKHKGVVGFEYMVILTIMLIAILAVFNTLKGAIDEKAKEIAEFISGTRDAVMPGSGSGN